MTWLIVSFLVCLAVAVAALAWTGHERRRRREAEATSQRLADAAQKLSEALAPALEAVRLARAARPEEPEEPAASVVAPAPAVPEAGAAAEAPAGAPRALLVEEPQGAAPYPGFSSLGSLPLPDSAGEPVGSMERLLPQLEFEADLTGWLRGARHEGIASFVLPPGAAPQPLVFQCAPLGGHPEKTASDWLALALESMVRPPARATELAPMLRGGCELAAAHVAGGELPVLVVVARGHDAALLMTLGPCAEPRAPAAFERLLESFRSAALVARA